MKTTANGRATARGIRRGLAVPPALVLLLLLVAATLPADDASVTYLEGEPEVRTAAGRTDWLDFGSSVRPGDSVVTGRWDFVELQQGNAATIRVNADTVFTIREVDRAGQRETVMSNSVGSVSYRFQRVTGRAQPLVGTTTTVAGVRGTELTIYAGADGSSLFLVESGLVEVSSAGRSVELSANQAVEVAVGREPGAVFEWKGRELDFSSWNQERIAQYLANPVEGTVALTKQLDEFIQGVTEFRALYEEYAAEYDREFERFQAMEDGDEKESLRQELLEFGPLTRTQALNYRYYALSGLSLRRFVLGRMYVELKTRYILDQRNPRFQAFLAEYSRFLEEFEQGVTPGLVDADI